MPKSESQIIQEVLREASEFDAAVAAGNIPVTDQSNDQLEREFIELFGREVNPPESASSVSDITAGSPFIPTQQEETLVGTPTGFNPIGPLGSLRTGTEGSFPDNPTLKATSTETNISDKNSSTLNALTQKQNTLVVALGDKKNNVLSTFDNFQDKLANNQPLISDSDLNTGLGKAANIGLNILTGIRGLASTVVSVPSRILRLDAEGALTPEHRSLFESAKQKISNNQELTPEEAFLFSPESTEITDLKREHRTIAERLEIVDKHSTIIDIIEDQQREAQTIVNPKFTDRAGIKLKTATDTAVEEFQEGENLQGISTFLGGIADLATEDTQAAAEVFAQSLPYMVSMVFAGSATIPAIATETLDKAIQSHREEYGEPPTQDETLLITAIAYTSAGLDKIGATATKNAGAIANSIVNSSKALNQKLPSALIQGVKTVGAPIGAVTVESATEGTQKVLEQVSGSIRDPQIDVSAALQDAAHGAIGGAVFSAPGVAAQAVTPVAKATKAATTKAAEKVVETGTKIQEAAFKSTEDLIAEKSESAPKEVVDRIISDGLGNLTPEQRISRLTTLINLNKELQNTENDETINNLIQAHQNLVRQESTGKNLQDHIKDSASNVNSINEVATAVAQGADLPLKTLNNISGSTLFTDSTPESQSAITTAREFKKSVSDISGSIKEELVKRIEDITQAVTLGDRASANKTIADITRLQKSQTGKLAAYDTAKAKFDPKVNQPIKFTYKGERLSYHPVQSKKLLENINQELVAINNTLAQANTINQTEVVTAPETTQAKPDVVEGADKPKKRATVQQKIEEPLTTDPKLAAQKVRALQTLASNSGKLPPKLTGRIATLTRLLGTVETRSESQLVRLNNELVSIFKAVRANVKPKPAPKKTEKGEPVVTEGNLTKDLLADTPDAKSLFIKPGKTPSKLGTAKGLKAKDIFKAKAVEVKGFFNTIPNFFSTYSKTGFNKTIAEDITADEKAITDSLLKFHNAFGKGIESHISFLDKSRSIFPEFTRDGNTVLSSLDQNPLGYLVKEDAQGNRFIDENVTGIMSTVMYNWLATRASGTLRNLDTDINSILGRDSSHEVDSNERSTLQFVGSTQNIVAETLGQQVVKQLGLQVTDQVDGNMLDRMATAIGLTMIATGIDRNYLELSKVDMSVFHKNSSIENVRSTSFIKLTSIGDNTLPTRIKTIKDTFNLSPGYINKVFGAESFEKYPSAEVVTTTPKFLKGTTQLIPNKLKKAILQKQRVKWEVKVDMHNIVSKINRATLDTLSGITEDLDTEHVTKRDTVKASNEDITRGLDNYFKSIDNLNLEDTIFFEYESFKNGRTTITSNMLNPASNKLHRHLVGAEAWNVTVTDSVPIRTNFKLAVAQAFGFGIDKHTEQESIDKFNELVADPVIQKGIKAVKALTLKGETSRTQEQALIDAVQLGGEKLHSLDGLVALSQYNPTEDFSTNLGIEVDGVTNGIAIGLMQAPVETNIDKLFQSVGIFLNAREGTNYPQWASNPANLDLYQTLASNWVKAVDVRIALSEDLTAKVGTLNSLIGSFIERKVIEDEAVDIVTKLGRDISKNPMMLTGYGSAIKNSVNNLTPEFTEKIYDKLVNASKAVNVREATQSVIADLNSLVDGNFFKGVNLNKPLEIELSPEYLKELSKFIDKTYGDALKIALETSFPAFFDFRNNINKMMNAVFAVFDVKYKRELAKKRESVDGRMLSIAEEQEVFDSLKKYQPLIKSALSTGLNDSLIVIENIKKRNHSNKQSNVQIALGDVKGLTSASLTGTVSNNEYAEPGARGLVFATQAQDAAIQATSGFNHDFLDIFDAKMLSIADVDVATTETNQAMWDITSDYSVMDEVHDSFKRVMSLAKNDPEAITAVRAVINKFKKAENYITVNEFNKEVLTLKREITAKRKEIKETSDVAVSQYAHGTESVFTANPTKEPEVNFEEDVTGLVDDWTEVIRKLEEDLDNPSGSSITPIDFDNFNHRYDTLLSADNSLDIFDDMSTFGNVQDSPQHTSHLREVLTNIVNKVLRATDTIEYKVGDDVQPSHGAAKGEKVYINASTANRLNNNNEMSLQEIQVHELMHVTLNYAVDNNFHTRQEIKKLFKLVDQGIRDIHGDRGWKIFMHKDVNGKDIVQTNLADEETAAKERYDYIFNNRSTQKVGTPDPLTGKINTKFTNDYLKEFIAFGLTNEIFINTLAQIDASPVKRQVKGLPFMERMEAIFNNALDFISGKIFQTRNLKSDAALRNLVDQLAGVTSKQRNAAIVRLLAFRDINAEAANKLYTAMIKPLTDYVLKASRNPSTRVGKAVSAIGLVPIVFQNAELRKVIKRVLRRIKLTEETIVIKLAREIQGNKTSNRVWHTLLRQSKHLVDAARKQVSVDTQRFIRDSFKAGLPDKDESAAITRVLLKGDLSVLTNTHNVAGLIKLLKSDSALNGALTSVRKELGIFGANTNYYINQAKGLGNWMALGKNHSKMQSLNAHNIANLVTDTRADKATVIGDVTVAEEIIDRLASLYALSAMSEDNKRSVADVMERENSANKTDNGIITLLNLQEGFKEDSLRDLFSGNKTQTVKGYTHETFNPRTDIRIGTHVDRDELLANGYVEGDNLARDPKNPNQSNRTLYVLKNAVGISYLKSIVSLTSKVARGTTMMDGHVSLGSLTPKQDAETDRDKYIKDSTRDINAQFKGVVTNTESTLIPIVDDQGNVTELRHMMTERQKIELLERDDRFDTVMGNMYGSIKDKLNSKQVNRRVVELAYEDFQTGFASDPDAYVKISLNSTEKRYKELFSLVPEDMRQDMEDVWGKREMTIRREIADLIFGYRKWSITNLGKDRDFTGAKIVQKTVNSSIARHIEAIWQEVVTVAKTNIVIRTPAVLMDNFTSNVILSGVKGVPIGYMIKNQALALRSLASYQAELKQRNSLQLKLDTSKILTTSQRDRLEIRIKQLDTELAVNPVSKMIDEGIFQAITEDLADSKSPYDFRDKILSDLKLDKVLNSENEIVKNATQQAFMTEETSIFKLLMKATQYSDFIARFALHKHNTEEKGMNTQESLEDVIETFVNYDIPTSKELQYMNDVGIFMFSKFLFRIQKVIFTLLKDRPVSSAIAALTQQVVGDVPDVMDSLGVNLAGRVGFVLGPLDTATDVKGLQHVSDLLGVE